MISFKKIKPSQSFKIFPQKKLMNPDFDVAEKRDRLAGIVVDVVSHYLEQAGLVRFRPTDQSPVNSDVSKRA